MLNKSEQTSDFLHVPPISGNQNESLHFVEVTEKRTANEDPMDLYSHYVTSEETFLKGLYLKMSRSKQISKKKFQILPNTTYHNRSL